MIVIKNLIKNYGKQNVLNIKDFTFLKGKSYLLVGSNGSGKSTLIKILLGINFYNSGDIKINSSNIAYVPEKCYYPEFCNIKNFLLSILSLYNLDRVPSLDYYCDLFKINMNLSLSHLSKGMMQKVLLIQAFIHDADLFIFDEPLNGLDKEMQEVFFNEIIKLREQGKTIIITTHYQDFYSNKYDYYLKLENGDIHIENN